MARIARQSRDVELASPSEASSGRMALRASVSGRYWGSMASGVNQSISKGARREALHGAYHRCRVSTLEPVRQHDDVGSAGITGKAGHGEECFERVADPGAAIPICDKAGRLSKGVLAVLQPQRAGEARQACAERENVHARHRVDDFMRQREMCIAALLHRAGYVDQEKNRAGAHCAPLPLQAHDFAFVAHCRPQAPCEVDALAAPRGLVAIAAPAGQGIGQGIGKPPQRLRIVGGAQSADRKGFRSRGGLARLVDVLADHDFFGADVVLHLHLVIGLPFVVTWLTDSPKEMQVEQGVKAHPLLRMRRKGCECGLAHMLDGARAEQFHRLKEAHRLLGGDRESVLA